MYWTAKLKGGPRRVNHAAVIVGDFIYSFGGYCTGGDYQICEAIDVHAFNTFTYRWSVITTKTSKSGIPHKYPDLPFQRYGHTTVENKNKIYLWGGRNDEYLCNIVFCFDPVTSTWSRPPVSGMIPGAREGHSACVANNCMYIFGGFEDDIHEFSCDVNRLNLDTMEWTFIRTSGNVPSFRDFHSAVALCDRMYIFGGRGDKHSPYHSLEEMYSPEIHYLDLKTNKWHQPLTTGKVPVGRRSHSMFTYNGLFYIFGGYNGLLDQHFNDLYTFDPKTNRWNLVKPYGSPPATRRRQVCLVKDDRMFMFGGTGPSSTCQGVLVDLDDTHILDFKPSLKTLCMVVVIRNSLDTSLLPEELQTDIWNMTQPNGIISNISQWIT